MMINDTFEFNHSTRICFGPGMVKTTGEEVKKFGDKVLIVCDKTVRKVGIVDKVTDSLKKEEIKYVIYDDVIPNPRDTGCEEAAKLGKKFGANVLIGIGGGSSMDTAKAANVLITNGGTCQEWVDKGKLDNDVLPLICIPTTSGTGSEVTFEAVITNTKTHVKISVSDGARMEPKVAIMDPELTLSVPPLVTASTGMDAMTHALEAYTCQDAQPITDGLAIYSMEKITENLVVAVKEGDNLKARTNMMVASLMAGMAFTNSFLGAVHSFAEVIGAYYDTPHGIACSIFLPFVTEYNMVADPEKHAIVAKCLGVDTRGMTDEEASKKGVEKLFEINEIIGIPKFKDIKGVNPDDFEQIARDCVSHPCTKPNAREIGYEEYLMLLKKAYGF